MTLIFLAHSMKEVFFVTLVHRKQAWYVGHFRWIVRFIECAQFVGNILSGNTLFGNTLIVGGLLLLATELRGRTAQLRRRSLQKIVERRREDAVHHLVRIMRLHAASTCTDEMRRARCGAREQDVARASKV